MQIDVQEIIVKENSDNSKEKNLEEMRKELEEAQREHEVLLERTKQNEILLIKERIRRETTETKLRSLKNDLTELENALKEKEEETRGYLLVSQNSLNEICSSFDSLLEMLESTSKNRNVISQSKEEEILRDDIRTKMALLIRKTKSESFRRGYFTKEVSREIKKFARSEADVRNLLPLIDILHYEKNIGDRPDLIIDENIQRTIVEENIYEGDEKFWKKKNIQIDNNAREDENFQTRDNSFLENFQKKEDSFRVMENNFLERDNSQVEDKSRILRKDCFQSKENNYPNRDEISEKEEDNFRKIIQTLRKGKEKNTEIINPTLPLTKERARAIFIQIINGNLSLNLSSQ